MRKYTVVFTLAFFWISTQLFPAAYMGKTIDEKHFPAEIKLKNSKFAYKVDVVFLGKAANIRFLPNQILPVEANNNNLITLYLKEESIQNPGNIVLKQVIPPPDNDNSKPEDWEAGNIWIMKIDPNSLK